MIPVALVEAHFPDSTMRVARVRDEIVRVVVCYRTGPQP